MLLSKFSKTWLIVIALIYLALIILIPTVTVFYEAFHKGVEPFLTSLQSPEFLAAVQLTVIIALKDLLTVFHMHDCNVCHQQKLQNFVKQI